MHALPVYCFTESFFFVFQIYKLLEMGFPEQQKDLLMQSLLHYPNFLLLFNLFQKIVKDKARKIKPR